MFTDEDGCPHEQDPDACEQCRFIAYLIERTEKRCADRAIEGWSGVAIGGGSRGLRADWVKLFREKT